MSNITEAALLKSIAAIGAAVLEPDGWTNALKMTSGWLGAGVTTLEIADLRTGAVRLECPMEVDEAAQQVYEERVYHLNPRTSLGLGSRLGLCLDDSDVPDTPGAAEYFDWLRPSRLRWFQGAKIIDDDGVVGFFASHYTEAHGFPGEDLRRAHEVLIPHVMNAIAVGTILSRSALVTETLQEQTLHRGGAMAFINGRGEIIEASGAFEEIVRSGELVTVAGRRLVAARSRDRDAVQRFIARALAPADVAARPAALRLVRDHGPGLVLRALPTRDRSGLLALLAPVAMITIVDLEQPQRVRRDELALLFDLTAREADVAAAIAAGLSPGQVAARLGIGVHTVRQHLKGVFRKMDAANQADIVRIAAQL